MSGLGGGFLPAPIRRASSADARLQDDRPRELAHPARCRVLAFSVRRGADREGRQQVETGSPIEPLKQIPFGYPTDTIFAIRQTFIDAAALDQAIAYAPFAPRCRRTLSFSRQSCSWSPCAHR
jgi:hypothetical protein